MRLQAGHLMTWGCALVVLSVDDSQLLAEPPGGFQQSLRRALGQNIMSWQPVLHAVWRDVSALLCCAGS